MIQSEWSPGSYIFLAVVVLALSLQFNAFFHQITELIPNPVLLVPLRVAQIYNGFLYFLEVLLSVHLSLFLLYFFPVLNG